METFFPAYLLSTYNRRETMLYAVGDSKMSLPTGAKVSVGGQTYRNNKLKELIYTVYGKTISLIHKELLQSNKKANIPIESRSYKYLPKAGI